MHVRTGKLSGETPKILLSLLLEVFPLNHIFIQIIPLAKNVLQCIYAILLLLSHVVV